MNLPNKLTLGRLGLAIVMFVIFYLVQLPGFREHQTILLDTALILCILAGITDYLDGYLARKWDMLTDFGRIADPLMDKVIVSGTFIFFLSFPNLPLEAWMVVVIISREFVVNGLRGYAESQGEKFGANIWGKWKTTIQMATMVWCLVYLAHLQNLTWADYTTVTLFWLTVVITLFSGLTYVIQAWKLFGGKGRDKI